jgi:hypothetical protein
MELKGEIGNAAERTNARVEWDAQEDQWGFKEGRLDQKQARQNCEHEEVGGREEERKQSGDVVALQGGPLFEQGHHQGERCAQGQSGAQSVQASEAGGTICEEETIDCGCEGKEENGERRAAENHKGGAQQARRQTEEQDEHRRRKHHRQRFSEKQITGETVGGKSKNLQKIGVRFQVGAKETKKEAWDRQAARRELGQIVTRFSTLIFSGGICRPQQTFSFLTLLNFFNV